MLGKEAALLVPSGTMGNLIAMLTHCDAGSARSSAPNRTPIFTKRAAPRRSAGLCLPRFATTKAASFHLMSCGANSRRPTTITSRAQALVVIENTHNRCGGAPIALSHMAAVAELARPQIVAGASGRRAHLQRRDRAGSQARGDRRIRRHGLVLPLEGARLPGRLDAVRSREFIERARRIRKLLGGGMRQAGIIAAAGIVALTAMVDRLAEDHQNARALAQGLALVAGINVRPVARGAPTWWSSRSTAKRRARGTFRRRDERTRRADLAARARARSAPSRTTALARADIDRAVAVAARGRRRGVRRLGCAAPNPPWRN